MKKHKMKKIAKSLTSMNNWVHTSVYVYITCSELFSIYIQPLIS